MNRAAKKISRVAARRTQTLAIPPPKRLQEINRPGRLRHWPRFLTPCYSEASGRGAVAMTARDVPAITGCASEWVSRRNRRGGLAAIGWGRELNLRHCHPVAFVCRGRVERYRGDHFPTRQSPASSLSISSPRQYFDDVPVRASFLANRDVDGANPSRSAFIEGHHARI